MSSLIIKELIKFVKKKFAADKAAKSETAKTAECERLFPPPPPPGNTTTPSIHQN